MKILLRPELACTGRRLVAAHRRRVSACAFDEYWGGKRNRRLRSHSGSEMSAMAFLSIRSYHQLTAKNPSGRV